MTFRDVFEETEVAGCIRQGIQALGHNSHLIVNNHNTRFEGSVDIDTCLVNQRLYTQENRWDYAFGLRNRIVYVEVHTASDSQVSVVIAKYQWLKDWQNRQPNSQNLKNNSSYHWIASGSVSITKNSRFSRSLTASGLGFPKRMLEV